MRTKNSLSCLLALALAASLLSAAALPAQAAAGVAYLPDVTEEMTDPSFWTAGMETPDALLATAEEIAQINAAALVTPGSNMHDLKNLPESFDGVARCESLRGGTAADAAYYLGWTWDETGMRPGKSWSRPTLTPSSPTAPTRTRRRKCPCATASLSGARC